MPQGHALQAEIDAAEAANAGQQTQIDAKANAADVHTKAQTDAALVGKVNVGAPIVISYAPAFTRSSTAAVPTTVLQIGHLLGASGDNGVIALGIGGPVTANGADYRLQSVEWCLVADTTNSAVVSGAVVYHDAPGAPSSPLATAVSDPTDRTAAGCYTLAVPEFNARGYTLGLALTGQTTNLTSAGVVLSSVRGTWVPRTALALTTAPDESSPVRTDLFNDPLPWEAVTE